MCWAVCLSFHVGTTCIADFSPQPLTPFLIHVLGPFHHSISCNFALLIELDFSHQPYKKDARKLTAVVVNKGLFQVMGLLLLSRECCKQDDIGVVNKEVLRETCKDDECCC